MFLECLESLLGGEIETGFRGVQSKSLMDIIQLECISQSSSVLRITNGALAGKIWIQEGEGIDAEAGPPPPRPPFQKNPLREGRHLRNAPRRAQPRPHDLQVVQRPAPAARPDGGRIAQRRQSRTP